MRRVFTTIVLAITALFILWTMLFSFIDLLPSKGILYALAVPAFWSLALVVLWKKYKMDQNPERVTNKRTINVLAYLIIGFVWIAFIGGGLAILLR